MRTALVVDIDGVVCPTGPGDGLVEVGMALAPVRVHPQVCAALTALAARPGVTPAWLTSWLPETRRTMRPPFPGHHWPQLELPPAPGWPKWQALTAWLADQPRLGRLVWIDDDLDAEHRARLAGLGLDTLAVTPAPGVGVTVADLARAADWVSSDVARPR